ncbi:hypothetical protein OPT61_g5966 [Boeremia exigua]|uniref:Uncharacterized protein n=1 Tax=Boeremia exigua TaxID=749465 RepID=A0ACC2I8D5_9PLEO|nr:hypothetical protein OPT61_g5966 [Boeremia exigua]
MVLRQPRTTCNSGLPIRKPSPSQTLQEDCFESQLDTSPGTRQPTCLHLEKFAPTPNRFSILADLRPTSKPGAKRRGKRGGKQQRLKHALKRACEGAKADGVDELCDRFATLRLDDNVPTAVLHNTDKEPHFSIQRRDPTPDVSAVRHHWAPQFRPISQPTSTPIIAKTINVQPKTLSQEPQSISTLQNPDQGLSSKNFSIGVLPASPKIHPQFPLSAFLKDLTSPSERGEHRLRQAPVPGPVTSPRTTEVTCSSTSASPITPAHSTAAGGVNCAPVLRRSTAFSANDAVKSRETVQTMSSFSTNATAIDKRKEEVETFRFTPSPRPVTATSSRPSLPLPSPRSIFGWQGTAQGFAVFHPSPTALITAPITSPYPFVYPQRPWTLSTVSEDFANHRASMPNVLKKRLSFHPPSPEAQRDLAQFLDKGHAKDCWCSSNRHQESTNITTPVSVTVGDEHTQTGSQGGLTDPHTPSLGAAADTVPESFASFDVEDDIESESSDSDVVLVTPPSGTDSEFEEFETDEDQYVDLDGEWFTVSPRSDTHQTSALPSPQTALDDFALTWDAPAVDATSGALPSPPQTPVYQARVSTDESETE